MKILVTGPESSGKSTLSRTLAWALDGIYVAESARAYLHTLDGTYTAKDLPRILALQLAAQARAWALVPSFQLCDTGPEVIRVWSEVKYGTCDPAVLEACRAAHYDLTLLCAPDLPWKFDTLREHPTKLQRSALFSRYRKLLPTATIIEGDHRVAQALSVILKFQKTVAPN